MSFFHELKRRNVLRVSAAYLVAAWLLIQVAETIFPLFGFNDTPARIVVIVLAIGFIPSLIFAWAFEMTPEGLKREKEVDRGESITPQTGKKLNLVIFGVMALALGYFAYDKFVIGRGPAEGAAHTAGAETGAAPAAVDEQQKSIKQFIREAKIKVKNAPDSQMRHLIEYCNSLPHEDS